MAKVIGCIQTKHLMNSMIEQELLRNARSKFQLHLLLKETPKAALIALSSHKAPTNFKSQKSSKDQAPQTFVNKGFKGNQPTGAGSQWGQAYNQPFRGGCFIYGGPHLARVCPDHGASSETPGRSSNKFRSAQVTATPTAVAYTEEELVKMLSVGLRRKHYLPRTNPSVTLYPLRSR